jgi:hypothetical protein
LGAINTFTALLFPKPEWTQATKDAILPFAQIATQVLHRLGGDYATFAEQVEQTANQWFSPPNPSSPFPDLEILEFTTGQLVEAASESGFPPLQTQEVEVVTIVLQPEPDSLQLFEFEVATLERQPNQRGGWAIRKQRRQAHRFLEALGDKLQLEMLSIPGGRFVMG